MKKIILLVGGCSLILLMSCHHDPQASATTTPSAVPTATIAVPAPTLTMTSPTTGPTAPLPGNPKTGKTAKEQLPPAIWDRMTRPLSLEEINKLPPETRDMILRAQGRLPASPTPKSKK